MDAKTPIRIVIVDDHTMLRKGLAIFLMSYTDLKLVGEASNGKGQCQRATGYGADP